MTKMWLTFTLKSDATFGRGEGVAGLIDEEVEHDEYGLPYLHGRTLKGLLVEECANLLYALRLQDLERHTQWESAATQLFGSPGSSTEVTAMLAIGDACLPEDLRKRVAHAAERGNVGRIDVIESLTDIRRQTAMDEKSGRPQDGSLRAMRVILRETPFTAPLTFGQTPGELELALLSACVLAWRRAGTGRNRGRGHLVARLLDEIHKDVTATHFAVFEREVKQQ